MIKSFKCKETHKIWEEEISQRLPRDIQPRALRKLAWLNDARKVDDLREPLSNHLESLRGNRKGQMSIRINKQWRICFVWDNGDAMEVEIVDYH